MPPDHSINALLIAFIGGLPAILIALAALWRIIKTEGKTDVLERQANGQREHMVRKLVEDAWQEGHRAGYREHEALVLPPPEIPPPTQRPAV